MLRRYYPQLLVCLPGIALFGVVAMARFSDESFESLAWLLYLDLAALAFCIVMSLISREPTPWQVAALFVVSPVVLALVFSPAA